MSKTISISYVDIFADSPEKISDLIKNIPSRNIMEVVGHFSAQIHMREKDKNRQVKLLRMWLSKLPSEYITRLDANLRFIEAEPDVTFNFINNISLLILAQNCLENWNDLDRVNDLTAEQELYLLKAYLLCTQEWQEKQNFKGEDGTTPLGLSKMLIKIKFPYDEILAFKDFRWQFLKAVFFFKFCETNDVFRVYVKIFLEECNIISWNDYLSTLLSLYIRKFEEQKTPSVLHIKDDHKAVLDFIRQFCLNQAAFKASLDFTNLRERPIMEIKPNHFLFINLNFLVDKFFQGIQFALFRALARNKATYKGNEIKTFDQFKAIYGEEISEKGLFYSIMDHTFGMSNLIKMNGDLLKKSLRDGEPDYYVRDSHKIYLFEYKDILINATVKHSYNFDSIKEEVFKKLVSNEKNSAKGVTQLVNSIEKLLNGGYKETDHIDESSVIIYPVIVFNEFTLGIPGISFILNLEFRKLLTERGIDSKDIKDLVLIDLNTLLRFQDELRTGRLDLGVYLDKFHTMRKGASDSTEAVVSFDMFMNAKYRLTPGKGPEMLSIEIKGMLREP